jgi:Na+/glutamate symporter
MAAILGGGKFSNLGIKKKRIQKKKMKNEKRRQNLSFPES